MHHFMTGNLSDTTQFRQAHNGHVGLLQIRTTYSKIVIITINLKASIEGLSECGLDPVEKSHGVRDTVEGQCSCLVIQIHSYSGGEWLYRDLDALVIVSEEVIRLKTSETPGLVVLLEARLVALAFPADAFISDRNCRIALANLLDLPVTTPRESLFTQNLLYHVKSLGMIRSVLSLTSHGHFSVLLRQTEPMVCRVWIQSQLTEICFGGGISLKKLWQLF